VNTPRSALARTGVGLFSTVLGAVLLLMVGGLLVADQALTRAAGERAETDAVESALVVERIVASQVEGLGSFYGVFLDPNRVTTRRDDFSTLVHGFASARPAARVVWAADASGKLLYDTALAKLAGLESESALRERDLATSRAVASRRPVVATSTKNAHAPDILLVSPLLLRGHLVGVAGALFDAGELLTPVLRSTLATRTTITLVAGRDTVLASRLATESRGKVVRGATVALPGGTHWVLEVEHSQPRQGLRITLWALGILAVTFLGGGMLRERRQALRVAERSAELERLSSELLRANRMKSEFLANVSHELRTPLNAIVGFVDLLRDGVYGDLSPRQVTPVERVAASATHLRHLVDQVLDIAKIAAGRLEVHSETIVLRTFVLNVASELEPLVNEKRLNLSVAVSAAIPRVRTDPTHLRQILVNLIGNAIKYTQTGGVAIRAPLVGTASVPGAAQKTPEDPMLLARSPDQRRPWIALQVIDTGIGIASTDQERIFDEFEQVNAGPRGDSMQRGTGLGLAISRRLARLLGGDITVDSQPGKGSTFTIWLPVSPAAVLMESAPATDVVEETSA
jgi:signal transduction histidine kinase